MTLSHLPDELDELRRRVAEDPDDIDARDQLADLLLEVGETTAGLEQLYTASERLGDQGDFERAIARLGRLLAEAPEHENAQRLLAKLYVRVPRQPDPDRVQRDRGADATVVVIAGEQLFGLPPESADVLARILPFDEEDPAPVAGPIVVPVPSGPTESAQPFLAALDKELRRSGGTPFEGRPDDPRDPRLVGEAASAAPPEPERGDGLAREVRVSPASRELALEALPPNPIIDMLASDRLGKLLDTVDLVRYGPNESVFDTWTPRGLYIVVSGSLHVRRDTEAQGPQIVDVLWPGDFFGEFELLTVMATSARIVAAKAAEVLEIPERIVTQMADERPEIIDLLWDSYFRRSFHSMMATSAIFSQLAVDVIQRIAVELEPLAYEAGDIVLREGQAPRGLYGVVGGSLAVVRPSQTAAEIVTRLSPGDFFGLVSSASGEPSRATVVASEDATLLWLPRHAMESLRDTVPSFARILREASNDRIWHYKLSLTG